jgi:hypothetical protein
MEKKPLKSMATRIAEDIKSSLGYSSDSTLENGDSSGFQDKSNPEMLNRQEYELISGGPLSDRIDYGIDLWDEDL